MATCLSCHQPVMMHPVVERWRKPRAICQACGAWIAYIPPHKRDQLHFLEQVTQICRHCGRMLRKVTLATALGSRPPVCRCELEEPTRDG